MRITKEDGTIDFGLLTSAQRMSYLDGWCREATGITASPIDGERRRCPDGPDHWIMFNSGRIERGMRERGAL